MTKLIAKLFADRVEEKTAYMLNCETDVRVTIAWHGGVKSVEVLARRYYW